MLKSTKIYRLSFVPLAAVIVLGLIHVSFQMAPNAVSWVVFIALAMAFGVMRWLREIALENEARYGSRI